MDFPSRESVERRRKAYPVGCRVKLVRMEDTAAPPIGTLGTVQYVDDTGSLGVQWDNGSTLSVLMGVDCAVRVDKDTPEAGAKP